MFLSRPDLELLVRAGAVRGVGDDPIEVDLVSIQLHLADEFMVYAPTDPTQPIVPPAEIPVIRERRDEFDLGPGDTVLACSRETVCMPNDLMGLVMTKGSLARGFILAHAADSQVDPGYQGRVTLELVNLSRHTYRFVAGMPIALLLVAQLSTRVSGGYAGRYQHSTGPTPMRRPRR